eukprot:TRINITY_DN2915_c0_g1_i1.p1 TRINITY_DN2915_c0_g1~~TRINITY_DN2915_c0_g1_i1.p1  ORF type:complete len:196 (-),score=34.79 TRINITY_DN2915_c0_g1_i1:112-699(-)
MLSPHCRSWDETIKLWDPNHQQSIRTWREHKYSIYSTVWSPYHPDRFASTSGDQTLKIWDAKEPASVQTIRAHNHEILSCDWNKYNEYVVVTASVDKSIKIWDIRNPGRGPIGSLLGHDYAVRRVKCSPHSETIIASSSYDLTLALWDTMEDRPLLHRFEHHSEFVVGVDFNIFVEGQLASCSWDETIHVWSIGD